MRRICMLYSVSRCSLSVIIPVAQEISSALMARIHLWKACNLNIQSGGQGQNATVLLRTWMLQPFGSRETSLLSSFAIEKEGNTEEVDT